MKITKKQEKKIFEAIGRLVVYGTLYIAGIQFCIWAFLQNTIY